MASDEADKTGAGERYDLEERTARFGEAVVDFLKTVGRDDITRPLIGQLMRSGGSVGANYCEANDAGSRKEFRRGIVICRREAKESKHWLRLIARADEARKDPARVLWREAQELNLIFSAIVRKLDGGA